MSWYKRLFAALMAHGDARQDTLYGDRKRTLFADLQGTVLEIGPGTGINLRYVPNGIRWIGVEPNPYMHRYIRDKAQELGMEVDVRSNAAEQLGLPDESVDAVVSTLVLCSVSSLEAALAEIRRVLKPGGRFYFIEHVAAPRGTWLRTLQHWIKPVWRVLADGCHPDRETHRALESAGFTDVRYEHVDVSLPVVKPHIIGVARKANDA